MVFEKLFVVDLKRIRLRGLLRCNRLGKLSLC